MTGGRIPDFSPFSGLERDVVGDVLQLPLACRRGGPVHPWAWFVDDGEGLRPPLCTWNSATSANARAMAGGLGRGHQPGRSVSLPCSSWSSGTSTLIRVPFPGPETISIWPPSRRARSFIPSKPIPDVSGGGVSARSASKPRPSSQTCISKDESRCSRTTPACRAAWRSIFPDRLLGYPGRAPPQWRLADDPGQGTLHAHLDTVAFKVNFGAPADSGFQPHVI